MKSIFRNSFTFPLAGVFGSASLVLGSMLAVSVAQAQQDPAELENLRNCAQLTDASARYACYDRMTATMRPPVNPNNLPVLRIPRESPPVSTATEDSAVPAQAPSTAALPLDAEMEPFVSKVTAVKEREPGKLLVTLENGQIWYQTESRVYPVRPGMEVKLFQGIFGDAWRLSALSLNSFIQVERVK